MGQPKWNIQFFTSSNDRCPFVEDFLTSLSAADKVRVRERLAIVEEQGPTYDEFSDQINKDIWELRFHISRGVARLFYFYRPNYTIVITHGVCKRYQKTKRRDIDLAMQCMGEHILREEQR